MITLIKGTEAACGTNAAGASTFGSATAVRLVNNSATARLVTVIDEVGGSTTIGTFTLPGKVKVPIVVEPPTESMTVTNLAVPLLLTRRTAVALPKVDAPAASVPHAASVPLINVIIPLFPLVL